MLHTFREIFKTLEDEIISYTDYIKKGNNSNEVENTILILDNTV